MEIEIKLGETVLLAGEADVEQIEIAVNGETMAHDGEQWFTSDGEVVETGADESGETEEAEAEQAEEAESSEEEDAGAAEEPEGDIIRAYADEDADGNGVIRLRLAA